MQEVRELVPSSSLSARVGRTLDTWGKSIGRLALAVHLNQPKVKAREQPLQTFQRKFLRNPMNSFNKSRPAGKVTRISLRKVDEMGPKRGNEGGAAGTWAKRKALISKAEKLRQPYSQIRAD